MHRYRLMHQKIKPQIILRIRMRVFWKLDLNMVKNGIQVASIAAYDRFLRSKKVVWVDVSGGNYPNKEKSDKLDWNSVIVKTYSHSQFSMSENVCPIIVIAFYNH